jgi:hypothetical protein
MDLLMDDAVLAAEKSLNGGNSSFHKVMDGAENRFGLPGLRNADTDWS